MSSEPPFPRRPPILRPRSLTFITSNVNKLSEVRAILRDVVGLELRSQPLNLVEIQGQVEDIARDKCRRAAMEVNGPVLTEDTALEFCALGGLPGPYMFSANRHSSLVTVASNSKWFLDSIGHTGLNHLLAAYDDKSAEAVCTFAFSPGPGQEPLIFQGRTAGKIVPARGPMNFGWDPIFEFEGKTYAEMDKAAKNRISHRYKALEKLKAWLAEDTVAPNS